MLLKSMLYRIVLRWIRRKMFKIGFDFRIIKNRWVRQSNEKIQK